MARRAFGGRPVESMVLGEDSLAVLGCVLGSEVTPKASNSIPRP